MASLVKASNPGKLKRHKEWIMWSRALTDYLSTVLGQDIVPLRYVGKEFKAPDYMLDSQPNYNYDQFLINCMPLKGLTYKIDEMKMHQLIHIFVQAEITKTWIKPKENRKYVLLDYLSLLDHSGGEGNKVVSIKEAEAIRT